MSRISKVGIVLGGYAAALLVACAAFYIRQLLMRNDGSQASSGMQAFGDLLFIAGLFGFLSLLPTALALYFLRPVEKFWVVLSIAALAVAATGPVAAATMHSLDRSNSQFALLGLFQLLRVLGAFLLGLGFLVCAVIAPLRRARLLLLVAVGIEGIVSGYAFYCLFVLRRWLL
jgi:hypothetical protein